ncbi:MAG: hypothetical protein AAFR75_01985 [Pseudomonadota bacterium]
MSTKRPGPLRLHLFSHFAAMQKLFVSRCTIVITPQMAEIQFAPIRKTAPFWDEAKARSTLQTGNWIKMILV